MDKNNTKTVEQKFQKLDKVSHILLRPGRYVGAIAPHTALSYVVNPQTKKFEQQHLTYSPALIKIFDEIISNSVDYSKTAEGKHLTSIDVTIDESGKITVRDNGGIVVVKHKEHDQYIPEMIFELCAGSNFDDTEDSTGTGQNGEGAALTNIFSTEFIVETCDGKHKFVQTHTNNSRDRSKPVITKSSKNYTEISFTPEYSRFHLPNGLDADNFEKLKKRVYDVAGCNPNLRVSFNGETIYIKSFKNYVEMYVDEADDMVYEQNDHWRVAVANSEEGFTHISFVNSTETAIGGNHVSYVADQIVERLREYFKAKHKVDVKPSDIRQHLRLFIDCTIIRPRYSSQTKDDMITEKKDFGTSYTVSEAFVKKILKSKVVQSVLDWVTAKQNALEQAELRKKNKELDKTNLRKIVKFTDASQKDNREECMLLICEGQSAANAILSARTEKVGCYPLKGKIPNALKKTPKELQENQEISDLLAITGLKFGERAVKENLRFGKIVACCDADMDGSHITGLLITLIYRFWPELLTDGVFHIFKTPIAKITIGKVETMLYSFEEYHAFLEKNAGKKMSVRYLKGLGSSTSKDFAKYFENMDDHLVQVCAGAGDLWMIDLAFGKEKTGAGGKSAADQRKEWLKLE